MRELCRRQLLTCYRSSALRFLTRRPTPSTAVCSLHPIGISCILITSQSSKRWITSEPSPMVCRYSDRTQDFGTN